MTRKIRRNLFIGAVVVFAVLGLVIILYAQGYRWDFQNNRLLLSGAVYIKVVNADNADITLNQKTTAGQTAALVKNLLPLRKYQARVELDGYQTWEKELEVSPGLVTQAENIVLFPVDLKTRIILPGKTVSDFSVSPDQKLLAVNFQNKLITIGFIGEPSATATAISFADGKKTAAAGFVAGSQGWSNNSKKLLLWRQTSTYGRLSSKNWYIWDSAAGLIDLTALYERKIILKNPSASPLATKLTPTSIKWLGNDNDLGVILDGKLLRLDIKNETVTDLNLNDIVDFDFKDSRIAALKKPGIIILMDSAIQNVSAAGETDIAPKRIYFSPVGDKVLCAGENALAVLWLKETSTQPLRQIGEIETVYRAPGAIRQVYWHKSGEYIIFLENQSLKAVELDGRGQNHNLASWPENIVSIDYISGNQKLYLFSADSIKTAEEKF